MPICFFKANYDASPSYYMSLAYEKRPWRGIRQVVRPPQSKPSRTRLDKISHRAPAYHLGTMLEIALPNGAFQTYGGNPRWETIQTAEISMIKQFSHMPNEETPSPCLYLSDISHRSIGRLSRTPTLGQAFKDCRASATLTCSRVGGQVDSHREEYSWYRPWYRTTRYCAYVI